jgi:hypothetical protein
VKQLEREEQEEVFNSNPENQVLGKVTEILFPGLMR